MRLPFVLALIIASSQAHAATFTVIETHVATARVTGSSNFTFGTSPGSAVFSPLPSSLGLPTEAFLGTPQFSLTLLSVDLTMDYRNERDVNVAGVLSPTVRVTPELLDVDPASDRPMATIDRRLVRGVTPALATGDDCTGAFSFCYAPSTQTDLSPDDFSGLVETLAASFATVRPEDGTTRDFSRLAGEQLSFSARGAEAVFSNNDVVSGELLFDPRFRFEYEITYTQPYLIAADPAVIPLPGALPLALSGLGALALMGRRRR